MRKPVAISPKNTGCDTRKMANISLLSSNNSKLKLYLLFFKQNILKSFCKNTFPYYDFIFSEDDMQPNPKNVEEIKNTQTKPESSKALQSFLGLTNYIKRFIHDYSTITAPSINY